MPDLKLLYDYAISFVGLPYRWGGSNPISGFDCSGLVKEILRSQGLIPVGDLNSQAIYDHFNDTDGYSSTAGLGALAFYGKGVTQINHVAFMLNKDCCIGADSGDHTTVDRATADKMNAFVKVRPVDYRKDLVAIIMPIKLS